jgi:hypothetical protein
MSMMNHIPTLPRETDDNSNNKPHDAASCNVRDMSD